MVIVATHRVATQSVWSEITARERIMADMGEVEVPITDCISRNTELVEGVGRDVAVWTAKVCRVTSGHFK